MLASWQREMVVEQLIARRDEIHFSSIPLAVHRSSLWEGCKENGCVHDDNFDADDSTLGVGARILVTNMIIPVDYEVGVDWPMFVHDLLHRFGLTLGP